MHATDALTEADRLMTVCNSCRYCEGLCAVFPAMEMRSSFTDGDLNYLANLCHGCGACYYDCQFSPPHVFAVNVPRTLAEIRNDTYLHYVWPSSLQAPLRNNGLAISLVAALSVFLFIAGFIAWHDPAVLFGAQDDATSFYRLMPHNVMVLIFGGVFLYAIAAIAINVRRFWRDSGSADEQPLSLAQFWRAARDAATLRYLDGGGFGCHDVDERPTDRRRLYHHFTFYGFMLCFAATSVATFYHYVLGRPAPYAWYDLPVLLGVVGGIGLLVGPLGLLFQKRRQDHALIDNKRAGMGIAFILTLFLTSLTGLLLLAFRETAAMGILLALHLGMVFGFFLAMPYGKFIHGIYRFAALVRYAHERAGHQDGR